MIPPSRSGPASQNDRAPRPEMSEKELILLGLLAEGESHAYGLEEKIRTRQMERWTAISFSSVYRVLRKLEELGLIETRLEHEGQGATRRVHRINQEGQACLAEGVLQLLANLQPLKNPFSVGLAFVTRAPTQAVLEILGAREAAMAEMGEKLAGLELGFTARIAERERQDPEQARQARLTVDLLFSHGRHHLQAERAFLSEAQAALRANVQAQAREHTAPQGREP